MKAGPQTGPLRQPKMVRGLMTADVLSSLGPETPPLVHQLDSHTIYFNPSWMSKEYAAHVGENLLVTVPRIAKVESIAAGWGDLGGGYQSRFGAVELAEVVDVVDGTIQAFDRMMGASYVTFSDDASQDLAATGLVRAYPDAPRITIASSVISMSKEISQTAQLQILDLLNDSVRAVAYPGQAQGAERIYRMTRGVCNAFLESAVGEALTGEYSASAANVLQAALDQNIPLAYVDADRLDVLARLEIPIQAKAFILDAVQKGDGVLVPERMVEWHGEETIAWWQLDLETGEMVGVGEDGTHQFLVVFTASMRVFVSLIFWLITFLRLMVWMLIAKLTWWWVRRIEAPSVDYEGKKTTDIYREAMERTKLFMMALRGGVRPALWGEVQAEEGE